MIGRKTRQRGWGGRRWDKETETEWVKVVDEAAEVWWGGWKGNRQPVYYQGSIEKHLGTNRTPPPWHPKPFNPCQYSQFSQTPGGGGRGRTRGRKLEPGGGGGLKMEYPSTTPPWCFRCCILATALRVWPVVIWLHSVLHFLNMHTHIHRHTSTQGPRSAYQQPKQALMYNN